MYRIEQTDCFEWLRRCAAQSLHAVYTDPPYGILEFTERELAKLRAGRGGVWRLPPKVGDSQRDPLPRFTVLSDEQKQHLRDYFRDWGKLLLRALVPGGHVCVAGHPILLRFDHRRRGGHRLRRHRTGTRHEYFRLAEKAIPRLAALYPEFRGQAI